MRKADALSLNAHGAFSRLLDPDVYEPLPDDWLVGITDVVDSTVAIASGRYEDVNFAGASAIAALGNAWGRFDFPFVFRGDGAAFALPPEGLLTATSALRQVRAFAATHLRLDLRVGLLTVRDIRAHAHDVRVACFAPSANASYAMFSGGGLKWAEQQIKDGRYLVKTGRYATDPDLTGLACEWQPFASRRGEILSLLVEPSEYATAEGFSALAKEVLAIVDEDPRQSHPLPAEIGRPKSSRSRVGAERWSNVVASSDFRKFDDGLRLTLDCTVEQIETVEAVLVAARARGEISFGLHRQSHALMTCLVPSGGSGAHLHFLDGQDGGYAKAALMMNPDKLRKASAH